MSEAPVPSPAREVPLSRIPFSERQLASIRALCNWMQIVAVVSILAAVGKLIGAFTPKRDVGNLIDALITFLLALWTYQAATAFRNVANTAAPYRASLEAPTPLIWASSSSVAGQAAAISRSVISWKMT